MDKLLAAAGGGVDEAFSDSEETTSRAEEGLSGSGGIVKGGGGGGGVVLSPEEGSEVDLLRSRAETVDLDGPSSESQDSVVTVRVPTFSRRGKHLYYHIFQENTVESFDIHKGEVQRKYEDFKWLHDRMREDSDYAGVLIPYLPPRLVFYADNPDELASSAAAAGESDGSDPTTLVQADLQDQLQKRTKQLELFLRELVALRDLHSNVNLQVFLTFEEELNPRKPSWFESLRGGVSGGRRSLPSVDPDPAFERHRQNNEIYLTALTRAARPCQEVVISRKRVVPALRLMCKAVAALGSSPNWKGAGIGMLARGLVRDQEHQLLIAEAYDGCLFEMLSHRSNVCESIRDLHLRRQRLETALKQAVQGRERAQANTQAAAVKGDKVSAMQLLEEASKKETDLREKLEFARRAGLRHLSADAKQRAVEIGTNVRQLVELQIDLARDMARRWDDLHTLMTSAA